MAQPPMLPILISGAGISGLALAQGLLRAAIPFRLFERDPTPISRSQGYRVRINATGIAALTTLLPPPLLTRLVACCAHVICGAGPSSYLDALTGKSVPAPFPANMHSKNSLKPPGATLEGDVDPLNCDRSVLRRVLLRGLEGHVEFGKEFTSYTETTTGVTAQFSDGTKVAGSVLVGADGVYSRVTRQLLGSTHELVDTEGRWIYGKTVITHKLEERFQLGGMSLTQDRSGAVPTSLLLEPVRFKDNEFRDELPQDYVYWVLQSRRDVLDMDDEVLLAMKATEVAELARKITSGWDASFHALFEMQDEASTSMLRITSVRPHISRWEAGRVTLIGDAVHAMSPSAGVGAVTALRDAAILVEGFKGQDVGVKSVERYEVAMREYAGEAIRRSQMGGKMLFGMRPFEELKAMAV